MKVTDKKENLEDLALRYSGRGMDALRPLLPPHFFAAAAEKLRKELPGRVLIATGFYVAGVCETDGPPGAYCLARTLKNMGSSPVIVTDELYRGLFHVPDVPVIYAPVDAEDTYWNRILEEEKPAALASVERCGRNQDGDYANMQGVSIAEHTAPIDRLFELAAARGIYTVGIGDGGNEIGMGNRQEVLRKCTDLNPCVVKTGDLLIATTSNWGAYALSAALAGKARPEKMPSYGELAEYIRFLAEKGCVDGISHEAKNWVDGFPPETEEEIYTAIRGLRS